MLHIINNQSGQPMVEPTAPPPSSRAAVSPVLQWAIYLLLGLYCAPLILIAYSCLATDYFQSDDAILKTFAGFAAASDESISLLHRVLLPMMGVFAPLAFRDAGSTRSAMVVMLILILGIGLSLFMSAVFNAPTIKSVLVPYRLFGPPDQSATQEQIEAAFNGGLGLVRAFFNRTQESMSMYLLLLFGLKLEQATAK
jgi:hypothetical protein